MFKSITDFDIKDISKEFDNRLYNLANQFRKEAASFVIQSANNCWKNYEIQDGMLSTLML